ncbi:MAG: T9SS type A sorting domain-containing protein [Flavobacteriales bacterium]
MKRIALSFALLFPIFTFAQDYYWVGNGGNWSDLNHWAVSSGGDVYHTELPGPDNNVIFDANSFTLEAQEVVMDEYAVHCRDFLAETALHSPLFTCSGNLNQLHVHGDFRLSSNVMRHFRNVFMKSNDSAVIVAGNRNLGPVSTLAIQGAGHFHQTDSITVHKLRFEGGHYHSHGRPIVARSEIRVNNAAFTTEAPIVDLSYSNVHVDSWFAQAEPQLELTATSIYINFENTLSSSFKGGEHVYYHVMFNSVVSISDDNNFLLFEAAPGATLKLQEGSVQQATQFMIDGLSDAPVYIFSLAPGEAVWLSQPYGAVNGRFLALTDVHTAGEASFYALDSEDHGNNEGWIWEIQQPIVNVDETAAVNGPVVYPNPSSEWVGFKLAPGMEYTVFNANGQIVLGFTSITHDYRLSVANWSPGLYFLSGGHLKNQSVRFVVNH